MNDQWSRYDQRWTDQSLRELENFAGWMNEIFGHHPIIIGSGAGSEGSPQINLGASSIVSC